MRAQISPHFIYNALNTIASFVRTDPDRARELILEFADFTRYSFRAAGQYTTLAEELRNIDRYLTLERARFGSALKVRLQVAPEVLNVVVPFLALQPLVENAVRHGFAGQATAGRDPIARDEGSRLRDHRRGRRRRNGSRRHCAPGPPTRWPTAPRDAAHVGLTNVDHRLRAAFGNDYGLVVETAIGAGTKVVMRVPKFRRVSRARRRCAGEQDARPCSRSTTRRPRSTSWPICSTRTPISVTCTRAADAKSALRELSTRRHIDAIFLDINMPGLSGIELAGGAGQLHRTDPRWCS